MAPDLPTTRDTARSGWFRSTAAISALLSALFVINLSAQGTVVGIVTDRGRPIRDVEVLIEEFRLTSRTNQAGEFSLTVPAGRRVVLARAVGFHPIYLNVNVVDSSIVDIEFELQRVAQVLDPVVTNVDARPATSAKLAGFDERRKRDIGTFLTRAELAEREHSQMSTVLRATGIQTIRRPEACGGGFALGTNRGVSSLYSPRRGRCYFPTGCYSTVYLDGILIWAPGRNEPPNIDDFKVHSLEAVEVYRSNGMAPIQYQAVGTECGVVLLWTRER